MPQGRLTNLSSSSKHTKDLTQIHQAEQAFVNNSLHHESLRGLAETKQRNDQLTVSYSKWFEPRSISSSYSMIVRVRVVLKRTVVGDWRFDNLCGSHLQKQVNTSASLKLIGQFSRDVIGCKTRVKSVNSNWSVSIRLLLVKLSRSVCGLLVGFVYIVN